MKKGIFLLALLLVVVILVSCANNSKQVPNENTTPNSSTTEVADSSSADAAVEETDKSEEANESGGAAVSVSLGETGENMSLPESYPEDAIPLLDDANIINVNENKDNNALGIIFKTDKSFGEAMEFYKEVMKEGTITVEAEKDDSYIIMGAKSGYGVMITISVYDGDKISVLINITF